MSKMQKIVDKAIAANNRNNPSEAIKELIEAIKLLSRGQAQIMGDIDRSKSYRDDIPIGSDEK